MLHKVYQELHLSKNILFVLDSVSSSRLTRVNKSVALPQMMTRGICYLEVQVPEGSRIFSVRWNTAEECRFEPTQHPNYLNVNLWFPPHPTHTKGCGKVVYFLPSCKDLRDTKQAKKTLWGCLIQSSSFTWRCDLPELACEDTGVGGWAGREGDPHFLWFAFTIRCTSSSSSWRAGGRGLPGWLRQTPSSGHAALKPNTPDTSQRLGSRWETCNVTTGVQHSN